MLNLKKTAVAVLALGSSVAFAGTMGPVCTPGSVTVPCESSAWDLGIQALYLKPAYNDGGYYGQVVNAAGTAATLVDTDPDWGWGFKLEGSYHFGTGNDVNLNWYHLNDNGIDRTHTGNFVLLNSNLPDVASERVQINPRWDAVNLEFGQHADFGQFTNIRFHGGVQYAQIKTDSAVLGVTAIGTRYSYSEDTKFNGFGPRVGADASYDFGNGLAVYAKSAAAILAGKSDLNETFTSTIVPAPTTVVTQSGSKTIIAPEIEAKLGLNYTYAMAQGDLSLDVGYMFVNYFNVQTTPVLDDSDFGVQGPYIGLKWVGSVV